MPPPIWSPMCFKMAESFHLSKRKQEQTLCSSTFQSIPYKFQRINPNLPSEALWLVLFVVVRFVFWHFKLPIDVMFLSPWTLRICKMYILNNYDTEDDCFHNSTIQYSSS